MKKLILILALCLMPSLISAQALWTSFEAKTNLAKNLGAGVEAEWRSHDGMSTTERWAGSVGIDYKIIKYLKVGAGFTYIYQQTETEYTNKGNVIPRYWRSKYRGNFTVTGSYDIGRFSLSLRERYQYTYRPEKTVQKFGSDWTTAKSDEVVASRNKNILRSRLEVEYNIGKKCPVIPFASFEIYNDFDKDFKRDNIRYTVGAEYKINKRNTFSAFYRYIDHADDDDPAGNVIGVGYKIKF